MSVTSSVVILVAGRSIKVIQAGQSVDVGAIGAHEDDDRLLRLLLPLDVVHNQLGRLRVQFRRAVFMQCGWVTAYS